LPHAIHAKYAGRDWASVARDYAARALTVEQITALYAISTCALYYRASREGWSKRRPPSGPPRGRVRRADFGQRLTNALERRIADFEARHAHRLDSGVPSAADAERDARTLNTLVRLYDKLRAAGHALSPATSEGGPAPARGDTLRAGAASSAGADCATAAPAAKDIDDPDGLRRELARRLEKLRLGECR
jgi:hypothetical protein